MNDEELLRDKQINPSKYVKQKERFPWATEYTGSLMAWLTCFMRMHSYPNKTYTPDEISHVECFTGKNDEVIAYEYDPRAFDIEFTSSGGVIDQIENRIFRFIMKDGAIFLVLPSEGHHSTRLRLIEPATRPSNLAQGLDKVLSRQ